MAQKPQKSAKPKLLSGGNPQIPKGHGDAPVKAYLAAMPGWKQKVGKRINALVVSTVPGARKAVKWNTPLYGAPGGEENTWFLAFHCFEKYVKVTFLRGAELKPLPLGPSKMKDVRYLDIREDDAFDEKQFVAWVKQASKLPGEKM